MTGMTLRQFAQADLARAQEAYAKAAEKIKNHDPEGSREFVLASLAIMAARSEVARYRATRRRA